MERRMGTSNSIGEMWTQFVGRVLEETPEHVDLVATDGSQGRVRVYNGAYRIVRGRVEVLIGGRAEILMPLSVMPRATVEISVGSGICSDCNSKADCQGTCCSGHVEFCCIDDLMVNKCINMWRCP